MHGIISDLDIDLDSDSSSGNHEYLYSLLKKKKTHQESHLKLHNKFLMGWSLYNLNEGGHQNEERPLTNLVAVNK